MILIIGGAYMGKLQYVKDAYGVAEAEVFDLENGLPAAPCRVLRHLESFTRRCTADGLDADQALRLLMPRLCGEAIVISREIGCGIVPMDPFERAYREAHGRILARLAERSEHVIRIFCGIAEVLK